MAYGYAIRGGLAEFSVIPRAVLDGDEGCYLLPIRSDTGYVESALTEPWACVVSAYAQQHRSGIKHGGRLLVVSRGIGAANAFTFSRLLSADRRPASITLLGLGDPTTHELVLIAEGLEIAVETIEDFGINRLRTELTQISAFDDILILGAVDADLIERVAPLLANHGILNLVGSGRIDRKVSLDIGRIHYNWHHYLGTASNDPADAYVETRTADLVAGGAAWFIGAGGPMGQMHVQRAVQHPEPPRLIVATDVDDARLRSVVDRFGAMATANGIDLVAINPKSMGGEWFDARLDELSAGNGFSDIVSMVPAAALIETAAGFLGEGGWLNIFAGVARGTMAAIDANQVIGKRVRFLGSSGSSLADMRETLRRVESNELSTNASLAAIGGMSAAKEGLRAVKEGWFPGKTLIFPQIHGLPLTPLPELKERFPSVYARMQDGQFWTLEAEEELLRLLL